MKIFVFAFVMALMIAMIGADSSDEKYGRHRKYHHVVSHRGFDLYFSDGK
ncbi:unnamed protein product [Nyctereutes procyonoides]|uniref:(raccoon dog) hypothetical protein n=1 Tax=Nyctereutes procyonoides TaxID=34880 RepID=A0A811Y3V8_NYCPR|nr:unnamed protein product [Nyctereutes procyonoides]